jgi:uncharacterized membrane protein YuzA (DUF378 family)
MQSISAVSKVGLLLAIVGAINWGVIGIFEWNPIRAIFTDGDQPATTGERIIYIAILAGGLVAVSLFMAAIGRQRARTDVGVPDEYRSTGASAMSWLGKLGLLLAFAGAVNWGLVGIFEWNAVRAIFTDGTELATVGERIVYIAVLAGGLISLPLFTAAIRSRSVGGELADLGTATTDERERHRRAA